MFLLLLLPLTYYASPSFIFDREKLKKKNWNPAIYQLWYNTLRLYTIPPPSILNYIPKQKRNEWKIDKKKTQKIYKKKSTNYKKNVNGWFIFYFSFIFHFWRNNYFFGGQFFVIIIFPGINTRKKLKKKKKKKIENMYTIGVKVTKQRTVWPYVFYFEIFLFFNLNKIAEEI